MRVLFALAFATLLFTSCKKKDAVCGFQDAVATATAAEIQQLQDSLTKYGIQASQHPSGFFYKIVSPGSTQSVANLCTTVQVAYKGTFFNGKTFDSTAAGTSARFQLGEVIAGWQKGVPLVQKGGSILLYLPPSLGYGAVNVPNGPDPVIPANSYLVFDIQVQDIQ